MNTSLRLPSLSWLLPVLFILLLPSCRSTAQVVGPIEQVDGQSYYMHTVEKKETLYSLSKLYKCDINDILYANPGLGEILAEGQKLKIPVGKSGLRAPQVVKAADGAYINHEVKKKETLYSISKQYNIDINKVVAANPGCDQSLAKGQILKIPIVSQTSQEVDHVGMKKHIVQPGETLYSITKLYGLAAGEIEKANPGVAAGIRAGQELWIPLSATTTPVKTDTIATIGAAFEESYSISLMLPFFSSFSDTATLAPRDQKLRDMAFDFYRGVQIAADSLEARGLSADLYVYDVLDGKTMSGVALSKPEMSDMDLIIGPVFKEALADVSSYGTKHGMHVVCPIPLTNKVLLNAPNLSKAQASTASKMETMAAFIAEEHANDQVILINTTNADDAVAWHAFRNEFFRAKGDSVKEFKAVNRSFPSLKSKLSTTKENVIVLPSNDQLVISSLFNELGSLENVIVYGMEEWENMEAIDPSRRNAFQVRYPRLSFVNYSDPLTQDFIAGYRKRFHAEPTEYAFLGYDILLYYGQGLSTYGRSFAQHFSDIHAHGLLANGFNFVKTGETNGYENKHVFIIGHHDYALEVENN